MARWTIYAERKEIEKMYTNGVPVDEIAKKTGKHYSTIYNELRRGNTGKLDQNGRPGYSARIAQEYTQKARRRRGIAVMPEEEGQKKCQQNRQ